MKVSRPKAAAVVAADVVNVLAASVAASVAVALAAYV